jgi:hypothetical protein
MWTWWVRRSSSAPVIQTLEHRELRLSYATFSGSAFAIQQLQLGDAQQETRIVDIFGCALLCLRAHQKDADGKESRNDRLIAVAETRFSMRALKNSQMSSRRS